MVFSVRQKLPEPGQYVLIHLTKDNWHDSDDPQGNRYWRVAKFVQGMSLTERIQLPPHDRRGRIWKAEDEGSNNLRSFNWQEFGPRSHFGQEVDFWSPLPQLPQEGRSS